MVSMDLYVPPEYNLLVHIDKKYWWVLQPLGEMHEEMKQAGIDPRQCFQFAGWRHAPILQAGCLRSKVCRS